MDLREIARCGAVYLDTNLYIILFKKDQRFIGETEKLFRTLEKNGISVIASVLIWHELLSFPRLSKATIEKFRLFFSSYENFSFVEIDYKTAELGAELRRKYSWLRAPDALHLATAINEEVDLFITHNGQLKRVKEIKVEVV